MLHQLPEQYILLAFSRLYSSFPTEWVTLLMQALTTSPSDVRRVSQEMSSDSPNYLIVIARNNFEWIRFWNSYHQQVY